MGFWTDLHDKMKADLLSGNWRVESYSLGGALDQSVKYTNLSEFLQAMNLVELRALEETDQLVTQQMVVISESDL